jgi:hypothetical protein
MLVALLAGCGKSTSPTAVTPDPAPPSAPTSVDVTVDPATGMATLNWADSPGNSVKSYQVFVYEPSPDRDEAYLQIADLDASQTSFLLPFLYQKGTQYFKVQSKNSNGNASGYSITVTVNLSGPVGGGETSGGGGNPGRPRGD